MSTLGLIALTILLIVYLLINRFLSKRISAEARYISGLILLLAFLLPFRSSFIVLPMPEWAGGGEIENVTVSVDKHEGDDIPEISEEGDLVFHMEEAEKGLSAAKTVLTVIYAVGVTVSLMLALRRHLILRKTLKRTLVPPSEEMAWQFDMLCGKLQFRNRPKLLVCRATVASALGAPFTFGIFRRKVVMPCGICGEEAEMLMEHELYHCKRHDAVFRLAFVWLSAMYWFYLPIIPFVRTLFAVCEESCDAHVTDNKNSVYRSAYGKLLIRYAAKSSALPVSFSSAGKRLKKRIETLFTQKRRHEGYILICVTVYAVIALMGTSFMVPTNKTVIRTGVNYLENIEALRSEEGLRAMDEELLRAFSQENRLSELSFCRYSVQTGELEYAKSDDLYFRGNLITTVILESTDKTESSAVSTYCDASLAKNCVGIRLVYKGERKADGTMNYARIVVLSDWELLDYYVWLLLPEEQRGASVYDIPAYYKEDGWEEKVLEMAKEKDPNIAEFYKALIERAEA